MIAGRTGTPTPPTSRARLWAAVPCLVLLAVSTHCRRPSPPPPAAATQPPAGVQTPAAARPPAATATPAPTPAPAGDRQAQADFDLGTAALARGDVAGAATAWERCLTRRERVEPGKLALAEVQAHLAMLLVARHDLDRAESLANQAVQIAQRHPAVPVAQALPLAVLGSVARERGEPERAMRLLQQALDRDAAAPPNLLSADILNRMGTVARRNGDLAQAQRRFAESLALWDRLAPDDLRRTNVLLNLGWVADDRGDLATARSLMEQAVAQRERQQPDTIPLGNACGQLALVAQDQGDLREAQRRLEQRLAIFERRAPDSFELAIAIGDLGGLELERGNAAHAADLCRRAVAIQERVAPNDPSRAGNLEILAEAELGRHHLAAAAVAAATATRLVTTAQSGNDVADLRASLLTVQGEVARRQGDDRRAGELFRQALALGERAGYRIYLFASIVHALGDVSRRRDPAAAARYYDESIAMLEAQIRNLGAHNLQAAYRARHGDFYRDAVDLAVERGRPQEAFAWLERSRGQVLLAQLAEHDAALARDVPPAWRKEESDVAAEIDRAELRQLQLERSGDARAGGVGGVGGVGGGGGAERAAGHMQPLRDQLAALHQRHDAIVARIRQSSPRYASLAHPLALDVAGAQRALDPQTVMLAYSLGEAHSYLFILSPDAPLAVVRLPAGAAALRQRVAALLQLIADSPGSSGLARARRAAFASASAALYDLLLRPAEPRLAAAGRLLIVPDGVLHRLPWPALVRRPRSGASGSPGLPRGSQFLVEWKPIHVALSATVYDGLRRRRMAGAPAAVVAFGDPQVPAWLRQPADRLASVATAGLPSALRGYSFEPLPYARQEVAAIAGLFPEVAHTYVGAAATEEQAKASSGQARYLHFATHTLLDEESPLDSAVVLTIPERPAPGADNGLLQAWEILDRMRLDADLVVLSGCESGLGGEVDGEGLVGLTRAFQFAGARSVVASLWKISDRLTEPLMAAFYRALRAGVPKDEALRQAQLAMLRRTGGGRSGDGSGGSEGGEPPFAWAGFELFGDWR